MTEEVKNVFLERYQENSKLVDNNSNINQSLKGKITDKPVVFPIGKNVMDDSKRIATVEGITLDEYNRILAVSKEHYIETESQTHITKNLIKLD